MFILLLSLLLSSGSATSTVEPLPTSTVERLDPNSVSPNAQCGWEYPVFNDTFCNTIDVVKMKESLGFVGSFCFDLEPKRPAVQCWYHQVCGPDTKNVSKNSCNLVQDYNGQVLGCDWFNVNKIGTVDSAGGNICVKENINLFYNVLYVIVIVLLGFVFMANKWRLEREHLFQKMYTPDIQFSKREKLREQLRNSGTPEHEVEEQVLQFVAHRHREGKQRRLDNLNEDDKCQEWAEKQKLKEKMEEQGHKFDEQVWKTHLEDLSSKKVVHDNAALNEINDEFARVQEEERQIIKNEKLEFFERYIRIIEFQIKVDIPPNTKEEIAEMKEELNSLDGEKARDLREEISESERKLKWNWWKNLILYIRNYVPILSVFFGDEEHYLSTLESSLMLIFTLILSFYLNVGRQLDIERGTKNFVGTRWGRFGTFLPSLLCQVYYFVFYKIARMDEAARLTTEKDDIWRTLGYVIPNIFKFASLICCFVLYVFMLNLISFLLNPFCYLMNVLINGVLLAQIISLVVCLLFFVVQWLNDEVYHGENCFWSYFACIMFLGGAPIKFSEEQQQLLLAISDDDIDELKKRGIYHADVDDEDEPTVEDIKDAEEPIAMINVDENEMEIEAIVVERK